MQVEALCEHLIKRNGEDELLAARVVGFEVVGVRCFQSEQTRVHDLLTGSFGFSPAGGTGVHFCVEVHFGLDHFAHVVGHAAVGLLGVGFVEQRNGFVEFSFDVCKQRIAWYRGRHFFGSVEADNPGYVAERVDEPVVIHGAENTKFGDELVGQGRINAAGVAKFRKLENQTVAGVNTAKQECPGVVGVGVRRFERVLVRVGPLTAVAPVTTACGDTNFVGVGLLQGVVAAVVTQCIEAGVSGAQGCDEFLLCFEEVIIRKGIVQLFLQVGAGVVEREDEKHR